MGVRSVWLRNKLDTMSLKLKTLEAKAAKENLIFTQNQLRALEKQWKVVAKFASTILSLGTIFLVTLTRDGVKNVYTWLTTKKPAEPKPTTTGQKI